MAGWAALAGGVLNYLGAESANKPRNSTTNQTSVQTPFLWDAQGGLQNDIASILARQREIAAGHGINTNVNGSGFYNSNIPQGGGLAPYPTAQIGPNGQTPQGLNPGIQQTPPGFDGSPRVGGVGADPPRTPTPILSSKPKTAAGQAGAASAQAYADYIARKGGGPTPGGAPAAPASPGPAAPKPPANPAAIFQQAAQQGFNQSQSPMFGQGNAAVTNILGASGSAGGAGGGQTGFEGYNPILAQTAGQLMNSTRDPQGQQMLMDWLTSQGGGGAGNQGQFPMTQYTGGGGDPRDRPNQGFGYSAGASGQTGGAVTDTMATPGFFTSQVRQQFDQGPNPQMEAMINASAADQERLRFRQMADIDAASQGSGRFGGSMWSSARQMAEDESSRNLAQAITGLRYQDFNDARTNRTNLLGQVNARDIAAMNDSTNRYGITSQANASAAGAAANAAAQQQALRLQGIGMLMGNENTQMGQLSDMGSRLSGDRLSAIGQIGDLSNASLAGVNTAINAGGQWSGDINSAAAIRAQQQASNANLSFARQQYNDALPQRQLNDYFGTIAAIGGMGGASNTQGTNVQPGAGVNPYGAAIQGALGAGTAAYGATGGRWW